MDALLLLLSLFALATLLVLWPRVGLFARFRRARQLAERALIEDALKHTHARELRGPLATAASLAGTLRVSARRAVDLIATVEAAGLMQSTGEGLRLTERGRRLALRVIRAHRLLERYLADELRIPLESIHEQADRREHTLSPQEVDELEARLGYPRRDPHGDPIPSSAGVLPAEEAATLTDWPIGRAAKVVHLEDEPTEIFAQIAASGLVPGMHIEVLERTEERLVVWDGEREYALAPVAASNVSVVDLPHSLHPPVRLTSLEPGQSGEVLALRCEGANRRRLLDLGLTPGTVVECVFPSPAGEPTAYKVRGALIALRREQAEEIEIDEVIGADAEGE